MVFDSVKRFSERAEIYSKYRPDYPKEILGILSNEIGFDSSKIVGDIACGTGKLARLFLENGNRVIGVEPSDEMRHHADRELSSYEKFLSIKGTAEETTLKGGRLDLISVGQALHWFEPEHAVREFRRISKRGGELLVVYNERRVGDLFMDSYQGVINRNERDRAKVPDIDDRYVSQFFLRGRHSTFSVANRQKLDFLGLTGRLASASYMPIPREAKRYAKFKRDARELFDAYNSGGYVNLTYDTNLYLGRIGS